MDPNKDQKIVIGKDGSIEIEWINPSLSDTILELLPEDQRKSVVEPSVDSGLEPKIYCG